jgi:hypothetical protein
MVIAPSSVELKNYMLTLLKIWEKTPASQPAVFNNSRISENSEIDAKRVQVISEYCHTAGWIQFPYDGAKDFTLTAAGLTSARESRRK